MISVMAIEVDDHRKKRKILSECALKWTPEEANVPIRTNLTTLPMTSAKLYNTFVHSSPGHVILFFKHHIKAVIWNGIFVLPGTPPGTSSRLPSSTSDSTHTDENTIIYGDETSCPAPADRIGPMSERDPGVENAVYPSFNDNILIDTDLNIFNMSATSSIYSQYSKYS